jgi:hypothetical protein
MVEGPGFAPGLAFCQKEANLLLKWSIVFMVELERIVGIAPNYSWLATKRVSVNTLSAFYFGPACRIQTYDLRYPKPSRYQAALMPDETLGKTLLRSLTPRAGEERE